jgi:hypothetical protein
MPIDVSDITEQFYSRLVSDSQGAAVRAALRGGCVAADLLKASTLPACPFVAFREGSISGKPTDIEQLIFRLFVYDDQAHQYRRINQIATLVRAAYPTGDDAAFTHYSIASIVLGDARPDAALGNLPCRSLTFQLRTRS